MPDIRHQDRQYVLQHLEELADLYEAVYAEPPYNAAPKFSRGRFLERTRDQVLGTGFALVAAHDNDALIGFAFGFTLPAGGWWGNATFPPETLKAASKFAVVELVVARPSRGLGLGRQLLDALLADRSEPYATLAAVLDAPAYEMYMRWGWTKVGEFRKEPPYSDALAFRISQDATPLSP